MSTWPAASTGAGGRQQYQHHFLPAREKSYSRSRHALTDFSTITPYDAPVSSIPQGLDFSPLPA